MWNEKLSFFFSGDDHSFSVTWVTYSATDSFIEFGTNPVSLDSKAQGVQSTFRYGDKKKKKQYVHRGKMGPLQPSTMYCKI